MLVTVLFLCLLSVASLSAEYHFSDEYHHKSLLDKSGKALPTPLTFESEKEITSEFWLEKGQSILKELLSRQQNNNHAKNVIMFMGDGMSLPTVAATRVYMGGEEVDLAFEKFPHVGFTKTYCVDAQVAESACTATAFLTGVKTNYDVIGFNAHAQRSVCASQAEEENFTESIASWAQKACKATGIVTTSRITHASPAGAYAHVVDRHWENDAEVEDYGCNSTLIDDIAEQLVHGQVGKNLRVILGGGRAYFRDQSIRDEEDGTSGLRHDGRNLIEEWTTERSKDGKASYVFDRNGLRNLEIASTDFLLGLFEPDHMKLNLDVLNQNKEYQEPSLTEMTVAAIKMLQKEKNGYFLFVESGLIDYAHHDNHAMHALDETKELSKAVEAARQMTDESDTLIVVTADHSHVFTYNGYPDRKTNIFGNAEISDEDFLPYTTLSYANGPGFSRTYNNGLRTNPAAYDNTDPKLMYPATVPRDQDTHGGEDVGVWASGPMAHLFRGSYDQTALPLTMAYILKVGPYGESVTCASCSFGPFLLLVICMLVLIKIK